MNNVNGVTTNNDVTTLNPAEMSQQDFISAVYLERGEMLDSEVRRIIGEIDTSNKYVETVNTLIGKANVAEYGSIEYTQPTWQVNGGNVVLDNGYGLNIQPDGNGGNSFLLLDAEGNQLLYQNQTLIPIPQGTTVDALEVGIPVMSDMTMILDDGTKITFQTAEPETAFNQQTLSGGQTNISSIVITRGNQGLRISGLEDVNTLAISASTVEVDEIEAPSGPETRTITANSYEYFEHVKDVRGSTGFNVIDEFAAELIEYYTGLINSMPPEAVEGLVAGIEGGDTYWRSRRNVSRGSTSLNQKVEIPARNPGESASAYIARAITESARAAKLHGEVQWGDDQDLDAIHFQFTILDYSYDWPVPNGEKSVAEYTGQRVQLERQYYGSGDHNAIFTQQTELYLAQMRDYLAGLSQEDARALEEQILLQGLHFWWQAESGGDVNDQSYHRFMIPGEGLERFLERGINSSSVEWRRRVEIELRKNSVDSLRSWFVTPSFEYDSYESEEVPVETPPIHTLDVDHNDGYVLLESGGVHTWEYNGRSTDNIVLNNPNNGNNQVTGYFARKLAFEQDLNNEFSGSAPFLTQQEKDLLSRELRITYADSSGNGFLTPEEWVALKESLINARDNLNGNSQLQTVQLQRAMTTYNQNFEAMSNAQQKIYSLLRDIIANVK